LAADLVERRVDVIVTDTAPATRAAQRATSTIPIVMAIVADPVGDGLVASLAQPGGNVTGLSIMLAELSAKRLQLLKEAMPSLTRVVALWNPPTPYHAKAVENLKAVTPSLAIELSFVSVRTPEEIVPAFEAVNRARAQALYVIDSPLFLRIERHFSGWQQRLGWRSFPEKGRTPTKAGSCPTGRATRTNCADPQITSTRSSKVPSRAPAHRAAGEAHTRRQSQDRAVAGHHDLRIDHTARRRSNPVNVPRNKAINLTVQQRRFACCCPAGYRRRYADPVAS
jgi:hypothetical protein